MHKVNVQDLENINTTKISGQTLKKHLMAMLASSSQCKAILECINKDTGEYRIVLQGILEPNGKMKEY
ncbi:MAG: hypothetical protein ACE5HS_03710 [bacterium]